jgi:ADP-heptose:LPS heptosyltransferase
MGEVIGDGLIKLPFLASLRGAFPLARIHWCAAKGQTVYETALKPVVEGFVDEVISTGCTGAAFSDFATLRRPFGRRRFDVVIDTQTNVRRSLVVRRSAGLFVSPAFNFRLSHRRPEGPWPEALVDRLQTLASLAAGRPIAATPISLRRPEALEAAMALLPRGPRYVGFAPGSGGVSKRWPLDRFLSLAQAQAARGRTPVFFLGPSEQEMAAPIRERTPSALLPELDRTDPFRHVAGPLLVIALASRLEAAVANDAGPGHMLAAGGAALLSLQEKRRKAVKFHPAAVRLRVLVAEDFDPSADMAAIPEAAAAAALTELLEPV